MANTILESSAYITATTTLQSLLFPTEKNKSSQKPQTLAERVEAIPTTTALLAGRKSLSGLQAFLDKELDNYTTVEKTERTVVAAMAKFLIAKESDIRQKRVIADTPLSDHISAINTIKEKARLYLNNTAFELSTLKKQTGFLSSWIPDPSCTYFERALGAYLQTTITFTTVPIKSTPAGKQEKTSLTIGNSTASSLSEDPELTLNPLPKKPTAVSSDEETPEEPMESSTSDATASARTDISRPAEEEKPIHSEISPVAREKNAKETTLSPELSSDEAEEAPEEPLENLTTVDDRDIKSPDALALPHMVIRFPSAEPNSPTMTPHVDASEEESPGRRGRSTEIFTAAQREASPSNGSVSPKAKPTSEVILASKASDESINPETPPAPTSQPTQQPNQLQLPKVVSCSQINTSSVKAMEVDKPTASQTVKPVRAKSQEPKSPKEPSGTNISSRTGSTLHRRAPQGKNS
ncbi:MAG TPA: hypothetical protein VGO47_00050 [Chlamydiales bacterium]|jgi:hypothetical protein|nr:hypothetical protein [Chlamydiales bacterium]